MSTASIYNEWPMLTSSKIFNERRSISNAVACQLLFGGLHLGKLYLMRTVKEKKSNYISIGKTVSVCWKYFQKHKRKETFAKIIKYFNLIIVYVKILHCTDDRKYTNTQKPYHTDIETHTHTHTHIYIYTHLI